MAAASEEERSAIVPRVTHRFHRFVDFHGLLACVLALVLIAGALVPNTAQAAEEDAGVPYWVSLRTEPANLRVGPGREYRISWVYVRGGLPLKVLRMIGSWRLVEDIDGARGWMLAQFLTRRRTAMVKGSIAEIRENADGASRLLWRAAPGVTGKLGECGPVWCRIDIDGRRGHIAKASLWGAD
jgi:SH3-like domain-containing protein